MKNAHERFGELVYLRRTEKTRTADDIRRHATPISVKNSRLKMTTSSSAYPRRFGDRRIIVCWR